MHQLKLVVSVLFFSMLYSTSHEAKAAQAPLQVTLKKVDTNPFSGLSLGVNAGFIYLKANTSWVNYIPGPSKF